MYYYIEHRLSAWINHAHRSQAYIFPRYVLNLLKLLSCCSLSDASVVNTDSSDECAKNFYTLFLFYFSFTIVGWYPAMLLAARGQRQPPTVEGSIGIAQHVNYTANLKF